MFRSVSECGSEWSSEVMAVLSIKFSPASGVYFFRSGTNISWHGHYLLQVILRLALTNHTKVVTGFIVKGAAEKHGTK